MTPAALRAEGLTWAPRRGHPVLEDVSLDVTPGQVLGIVGPNGAGKSTLLRLLYRYLRPASGRVLVDGQDIWEMEAREVARSVAVVLQEQPSDFALTVREIVTLGRAPHRSGLARPGLRDERIVATALARLDLSRLADRRIGTLSGGERQRVMVARALAQEPRLLILDEPTNHLDIRHQLEVLALVRTLGLTVVTSLHDINLAADLADRVLVLARGRCLAQGVPAEVLTEDLIARAFHVRVQRQTLTPSGAAHLTFHL
ncbi:ABC transporter ATP-binding protein [Jannaschia seohaensis]|uniref:Iron complex transport system ATP-binding protein n=1 Tax=Jannaschia seohaensis TaxID=475081 RepID=A0A2Y9AZ88_9RHOB|nr:ABC transporter ATP-binding protein [Jannaschia seohaensis]PWJ15886.1 iron complex transport system ATP-binding protein [Jannaschia seohaensis]SSA49594.1 iron complex transport system ATP-binding protein [Jannaschia seohaensis]